jgi:hypothetical protein
MGRPSEIGGKKQGPNGSGARGVSSSGKRARENARGRRKEQWNEGKPRKKFKGKAWHLTMHFYVAERRISISNRFKGTTT